MLKSEEPAPSLELVFTSSSTGLYVSVEDEPPPLEVSPIPQPYSAEIAIFGAIKYSAPTKPLSIKPNDPQLSLQYF